MSYNKFGFYKENNLSFTDKNLRLNKKKTIRSLKRAYKEIENFYRKRSRSKKIFKPRYLGALMDEVHFIYLRKHACGAGRSFLSVDWDGNVLPCAQFKNEVITKVGDKDLIKAGEEYFKNSKKGMKNLHVDKKEDCKDCQWRYWCGGGCPGVTYRAFGRYDTKSPYCEIYKAIIPEFLKLEGYRILSERKLL